jgi:RNA polymerase sigma-70 factor (ECF subfamily)
MDDPSILQAIKFDNEKAYKTLFDKYYKPLKLYINSYTKNQELSDDIVQQCFISIWERRKKLSIKTSLKSYLYSSCYNIFIDQYRKEVKNYKLLDELKEKALRKKIVEDPKIFDERVAKLKRIIESLPPRCKEILLMNKFQEYTYSEIAEILNISKKTVDAQMQTAFKKLREGFKNNQLLLFLVNNLDYKRSPN